MSFMERLRISIWSWEFFLKFFFCPSPPAHTSLLKIIFILEMSVGKEDAKRYWLILTDRGWLLTKSLMGYFDQAYYAIHPLAAIDHYIPSFGRYGYVVIGRIRDVLMTWLALAGMQKKSL